MGNRSDIWLYAGLWLLVSGLLVGLTGLREDHTKLADASLEGAGTAAGDGRSAPLGAQTRASSTRGLLSFALTSQQVRLPDMASIGLPTIELSVDADADDDDPRHPD